MSRVKMWCFFVLFFAFSLPQAIALENVATSIAWETNSFEQDHRTSFLKGEHVFQIQSTQANDASFLGKMTLKRNTNYVFSAEISTEEVHQMNSPSNTGASLSVELPNRKLLGKSNGLHGNNGWTHQSASFRTSNEDVPIHLMLRLGNYSGVTTGSAFFRNVQLIEVDYDGWIGNGDIESFLNHEPLHWTIQRPESLPFFDPNMQVATASLRAENIPTFFVSNNQALCIKTFSAGIGARWKQMVTLEENSIYELTAMIQADTQARLGVDGQAYDSSMIYQFESVTDTNGWKMVRMLFETGISNRSDDLLQVDVWMDIDVPFGTACFDDIALEKRSSFQRMTKMGKLPIGLDLKESTWKKISAAKQYAFLNSLDGMYHHFVQLMGNVMPNSKPIVLRENGIMKYRALAGYPILMDVDMTKEMIQLANKSKPVIHFGVVHEISHDFDDSINDDYYMNLNALYATSSANVFNAEHWANFKAVYVLEQMAKKQKGLNVFLLKDLPTYDVRTFGMDYFYGKTRAYLVKNKKLFHRLTIHDLLMMSNDEGTGVLLAIQKRIGWEPFQQAFHEYQRISLNEQLSSKMANYSDREKLTLFFKYVNKYSKLKYFQE